MKILYKHRTRGQAVEAVHIKGMVGGLRIMGCEVDFSSPPLVRVDSSHYSFKNKLLKLISLKAPTIVYESMALLYNWNSYKNTQKLIIKNRYDFIYERYAFFDFSTVLLKRKGGIPVVLEVNLAVNRKDPTHGRKIVMKKLAGYLEKKVFEVSDLITVVSTSIKESLTEIGIDPNRILVLPNAVDIRVFDKAVSGDEIKLKYGLQGKKIIGFVGSFMFWHGLDFLLESLADALKSQKNLHLLLVGNGHEMAKIKKMTRDLGLCEYVTMTGQVPHSEIPFYIAAMDIGVMPDSNDFGSPMKIFEYMAMGKPVISARYGPTAEVIRDGINGFLFEPGNGEQLTGLVMKLMGDNQSRKSVGENARNCVFDNHTWDRNAQRIINLFQALKADGEI